MSYCGTFHTLDLIPLDLIPLDLIPICRLDHIPLDLIPVSPSFRLGHLLWRHHNMKLFNKFITTIRLLLLLQITENSSESNPDVRTLQDCLNSENEPPNLAQEDFNEMTRSCFTP